MVSYLSVTRLFPKFQEKPKRQTLKLNLQPILQKQIDAVLSRSSEIFLMFLLFLNREETVEGRRIVFEQVLEEEDWRKETI